MTKRAVVVLLACLAIAAVVAGCGGGDDTTSGGDSTEASGSAPTKAVFIDEADAICERGDLKLNREIEAYAEENGFSRDKEPSQEQQVEIYEAVVLPNVAKQGEEIAALTPPEGDEETVEEITDALAAGVEAAEADPQQFVEGKDPLAGASQKAQAYGLSCGSE